MELLERILTYLEATDANMTEKMGLNETVERVLVYETKRKIKKICLTRLKTI